jgi:oxygen-independent coproporphyrinogen-3 oxidase
MKIDRERLEELLPRYETAGPRYTSYPTAPSWQSDIDAKGYRELLAAIPGPPTGKALSLYVHVPFCRSLCHFCACNRVITRKAELPARYLDVIEREIEAVREALGDSRPASQLHFGGGTPTHLTPEELARLIDAVDAAFPAETGAERSIEVDPRVTTHDHIDVLAARDFDRISMGVQDFDPRVQQAVHREQSIELVADLVERARRSGFAGVNFDLIYGLPFQTEESFARTLDAVVAQAPDRIALYSYAHVTWVAKQQRGFERHDLPGGPEKLRIMLLAIERLLEAGYEYVGMDHFARGDDALARALRDDTLHRNFMGYTTKTSEDLIAFGPSGISELEAAFVQSARELDAWQQRVEREGLAAFRGHRLTDEDRCRGWVIKQIMCRGGVRAADYDARFGEAGGFGEAFGSRFAKELEALSPFEQDGLVVREADGGFRTTDEGRLLVRNVAMVFDAYLAEQQRQSAPLFSKTI